MIIFTLMLVLAFASGVGAEEAKKALPCEDCKAEPPALRCGGEQELCIISGEMVCVDYCPVPEPCPHGSYSTYFTKDGFGCDKVTAEEFARRHPHRAPSD